MRASLLISLLLTTVAAAKDGTVCGRGPWYLRFPVNHLAVFWMPYSMGFHERADQKHQVAGRSTYWSEFYGNFDPRRFIYWCAKEHRYYIAHPLGKDSDGDVRVNWPYVKNAMDPNDRCPGFARTKHTGARSSLMGPWEVKVMSFAFGKGLTHAFHSTEWNVQNKSELHDTCTVMGNTLHTNSKHGVVTLLGKTCLGGWGELMPALCDRGYVVLPSLPTCVDGRLLRGHFADSDTIDKFECVKVHGVSERLQLFEAPPFYYIFATSVITMVISLLMSGPPKPEAESTPGGAPPSFKDRAKLLAKRGSQFVMLGLALFGIVSDIRAATRIGEALRDPPECQVQTLWPPASCQVLRAFGGAALVFSKSGNIAKIFSARNLEALHLDHYKLKILLTGLQHGGGYGLASIYKNAGQGNPDGSPEEKKQWTAGLRVEILREEGYLMIIYVWVVWFLSWVYLCVLAPWFFVGAVIYFWITLPIYFLSSRASTRLTSFLISRAQKKFAEAKTSGAYTAVDEAATPVLVADQVVDFTDLAGDKITFKLEAGELNYDENGTAKVDCVSKLTINSSEKGEVIHVENHKSKRRTTIPATLTNCEHLLAGVRKLWRSACAPELEDKAVNWFMVEYNKKLRSVAPTRDIPTSEIFENPTGNEPSQYQKGPTSGSTLLATLKKGEERHLWRGWTVTYDMFAEGKRVQLDVAPDWTDEDTKALQGWVPADAVQPCFDSETNLADYKELASTFKYTGVSRVMWWKFFEYPIVMPLLVQLLTTLAVRSIIQAGCWPDAGQMPDAVKDYLKKSPGFYVWGAYLYAPYQTLTERTIHGYMSSMFQSATSAISSLNMVLR